MKFEIVFDGNGFSTFVIDGVRITPECLAAIIHPREDVWIRFRRDGDMVIAEQKEEVAK